MNDVIGIGVRAALVTGVCLRGARVDAHAERAFESAEQRAGAMLDVVRELMRAGARRPTLAVALGPSTSQFRPLHGMPKDLDAEVASSLVSANLERFFLGDAQQMLPSAVSASGDSPWAGTFAKSVIDDVIRVATAVRARSVRCVPTLAVLGALRPNGVLDWQDGPSMLTVEYRGGLPMSAQVVRPRELTAFREADLEHADALGAALAAGRSPFSIDPLAPARRQAQHRHTRRFLGVLFAAGVLLSLFGPGAMAWVSARRARAETALIGVGATAAGVRVAARLDAEAAQERVATFRASGRSMLAVLADLARTLPDSSAVVTLRVDSTTAFIVALSPSGARLVEDLATTASSIERPQLIGAITRETVGSRELQRVALTATLRTSPIKPGARDAN